jgi:hypothetical protein
VVLTVSSRKIPTVTWAAPTSTGGAAVRYVVTIKNSRGATVATSPSLTDTRWLGARTLVAGTYTATVVASNSAGAAPAVTSRAVTVR